MRATALIKLSGSVSAPARGPTLKPATQRPLPTRYGRNRRIVRHVNAQRGQRGSVRGTPRRVCRLRDDAPMRGRIGRCPARRSPSASRRLDATVWVPDFDAMLPRTPRANCAHRKTRRKWPIKIIPMPQQTKGIGLESTPIKVVTVLKLVNTYKGYHSIGCRQPGPGWVERDPGSRDRVLHGTSATLRSYLIPRHCHRSMKRAY